MGPLSVPAPGPAATQTCAPPARTPTLSSSPTHSSPTPSACSALRCPWQPPGPAQATLPGIMAPHDVPGLRDGSTQAGPADRGTGHAPSPQPREHRTMGHRGHRTQPATWAERSESHEAGAPGGAMPTGLAGGSRKCCQGGRGGCGPHRLARLSSPRLPGNTTAQLRTHH